MQWKIYFHIAEAQPYLRKSEIRLLFGIAHIEHHIERVWQFCHTLVDCAFAQDEVVCYPTTPPTALILFK